jgi:hypothetical protein
MLATASLLSPGPLAAPGVRFNGRTRTPVLFTPADVAAAGAPPAFCPAAGRGGGVYETVPITYESPGAGLYSTTGPAATSVRLTTLTFGVLAGVVVALASERRMPGALP